MVQVVENRSILSGQVQHVEAAGDAAAITLRVERAEPVAGMANLLQGTVGNTITVTVPVDGGDALPRPGDQIRCEAHLAGPQRYYAVAGSVETR